MDFISQSHFRSAYLFSCQGIATFWASRVQLSGGQYVINNVIPPDECVLIRILDHI